MFEIDTVKAAFEEEKALIEARIVDQEKLISLLSEKEQSLSESLDVARDEYTRARQEADTEYLDQYDRVRKLVKRAPYLVAIKSQKCGGCHLRVSNEVSHAAATGGEPHFCDQCARMVYA
jgi:predicted  nucleic acid-binding Zn-ribbon protein